MNRKFLRKMLFVMNINSLFHKKKLANKLICDKKSITNNKKNDKNTIKKNYQ